MRNKRQSGLRSLISNWRRRKSKSNYRRSRSLPLSILPLHGANLWTPESAQGQMLEQLGFTLAKLPAGLNASQSQGKRHDIIQLGGENLAAGLNGESLFLFAGDQKMPMLFMLIRCSRTCLQYKTSRFMRWEPRRSVWITTAPCKCWIGLRRCFKH